jgi:hypothetical protein
MTMLILIVVGLAVAVIATGLFVRRAPDDDLAGTGHAARPPIGPRRLTDRW